MHPTEISPLTFEIYNYIKQKTDHLTTVDESSPIIQALAEEIYETHIKTSHLNLIVDAGGHNKGHYDNRTLQDIIDNDQYERISNILFDSSIFTVLLCIEKCITFKNGLEKYIDTEEKLIEYLEHSLYKPFDSPTFNCYECGQTYRLHVNSNRLSLDREIAYRKKPKGQDPCEFPHGVGAYSYIINIPSGRFVLANKLVQVVADSVFDKGRNGNFLLEKTGDYTLGDSNYLTKLNQEYWNDNNVIYIFTGNSNPSAFWNEKENSVTIKAESRYICDGADRDDEPNYTADEILKGFIDTDLWAVCAMDYDYFVTCCNAKGMDVEQTLKQHDAFMIDVPAGAYEIQYLGSVRQKYYEPHAIFKKVTNGECLIG